jgi:hypothetical protein
VLHSVIFSGDTVSLAEKEGSTSSEDVRVYERIVVVVYSTILLRKTELTFVHISEGFAHPLSQRAQTNTATAQIVTENSTSCRNVTVTLLDIYHTPVLI